MTKTLRKPIEGTPATEQTSTELKPQAVREMLGLELAEMAEVMGMGEFGYSAWERGTRRPGGPAFQLLKVINDAGSKVLPVLRDVQSN
ncbi:hypothetical protein KO498_16330 [Lentibacter algarum]|uniref:helix-turn-helix domain-containing protein n=1 Tax=Lentibacter algarum TaxID=576131 RepID=UPI001C09DC60|nr:hypothetical protein [Lentibacter algarum]MBU2983374.1 hypothetical protein [Lentibacter algarum]